jgi:organic hydroperoxide reductase OsmC/OhrA
MQSLRLRTGDFCDDAALLRNIHDYAIHTASVLRLGNLLCELSDMRHSFALNLRWRNTREFDGEFERDYSHEGYVSIPGHGSLVTSAAEAFGGDPNLWNPEQLLMSAISQCHLLSFLYVANRDGVDILDYLDDVTGEMEYQGGRGAMTSVTLRPTVVTLADPREIERLHEEAKAFCVMRSSVNFPIDVEVFVRVPEANID